jgi:SAM-dependent methyltransferase
MKAELCIDADQLALGGPLGFATERDLVTLAAALDAPAVPVLSPAEERLLGSRSEIPDGFVAQVRRDIAQGQDPLGELFCEVRSPVARRSRGAVYTPLPIVRWMLQRIADQGEPARVVDPGSGSGRFLVEAGRAFPCAELVAVELDPVAALLTRAHVAAAGLACRARVIVEDYRSVRLPPIGGRTAFIGNPPYVRHHLIDTRWKQWLTDQARSRNLQVSQLAGLHAHFYLATAIHARPGDFGTFITAAEWLDVNYGSLVRGLFLESLGGRSIVVVEPSERPFPDALATGAVTEFEVGKRPDSIRFERVASVAAGLATAEPRLIRRERLESERRWSHLTRSVRRGPDGYIELGEICRVHRGQVTGANKVWTEGPHSAKLPESVFFPAVTRARELFEANGRLANDSMLRRIVDLPEDLSVFSPSETRAIDRFLATARRLGVHLGYVASKRRAWWSVGLRTPAPILATYMARRPPAFVRNVVNARHINIAHGLYPREPLAEAVLERLTRYLATGTSTEDGRTYAGGLTKFEPREMERLLVPSPDMLMQLSL